MAVGSDTRGALASLLGDAAVLPTVPPEYVRDQTAWRGIAGAADAVVVPRAAEEVAAAVAWCAERGVPVTPRGGGTGYAGGAVPEGGVVIALERLRRIAPIEPELWRVEAGAGATTLAVQRAARESGLFFPPDPGAPEQSQIGGNVATNAGGPHCFKYGVTGAWVHGVEVVLADGELLTLGGPVRKDVAGLDLRSLVVGSEGALAVITRVWLRLIPAPELALPVVAFLPDVHAGCAAIGAALTSGALPATVEYLDRRALAIAGRTFPGGVPDGAGFLLIFEADGSAAGARADRALLVAALGDCGADVRTPEGPAAVAALWRWRDTLAGLVGAVRGGKVSEDVAVPRERLAEIIEASTAIGVRHGVEVASWGHAGDGNIHANVLCDLADPDEVERAVATVEDVARAAVELGGTVSGEHGAGRQKVPHRVELTDPRRLALERRVKDALDPRGILNPGVKLPGRA